MLGVAGRARDLAGGTDDGALRRTGGLGCGGAAGDDDRPDPCRGRTGRGGGRPRRAGRRCGGSGGAGAAAPEVAALVVAGWVTGAPADRAAAVGSCGAGVAAPGCPVPPAPGPPAEGRVVMERADGDDLAPALTPARPICEP